MPGIVVFQGGVIWISHFDERSSTFVVIISQGWPIYKKEWSDKKWIASITYQVFKI